MLRQWQQGQLPRKLNENNKFKNKIFTRSATKQRRLCAHTRACWFLSLQRIARRVTTATAGAQPSISRKVFASHEDMWVVQTQLDSWHWRPFGAATVARNQACGELQCQWQARVARVSLRRNCQMLFCDNCKSVTLPLFLCCFGCCYWLLAAMWQIHGSVLRLPSLCSAFQMLRRNCCVTQLSCWQFKTFGGWLCAASDFLSFTGRSAVKAGWQRAKCFESNANCNMCHAK